MSLEVINNTLKELAPALAVSGIGLNLLFQGFNWLRQKNTAILGATTFAFGVILAGVGILALFAAAGDDWCAALLWAIVFVAAAFLVPRFMLKKAHRKK